MGGTRSVASAPLRVPTGVTTDVTTRAPPDTDLRRWEENPWTSKIRSDLILEVDHATSPHVAGLTHCRAGCARGACVRLVRGGQSAHARRHGLRAVRRTRARRHGRRPRRARRPHVRRVCAKRLHARFPANGGTVRTIERLTRAIAFTGHRGLPRSGGGRDSCHAASFCLQSGTDAGVLVEPEFATSFFEKRGLSQCSRGSREKSAIIFSTYISERLDA